MKNKRFISAILAGMLVAAMTLPSYAVTNETGIEFITDGVDFHQVNINEVFPNIKPEDIKVVTFSFSVDLSGVDVADGQIAVNSPTSGWVEADVDLTLLGGSMTTSLDVTFGADDKWYNCSVATWGFESGVVIDLLNASGQSLINDPEAYETEEAAEETQHEETVPEITEDEYDESDELEEIIDEGIAEAAEDLEYSKGEPLPETPDTGVELFTPLVSALTALTASIAARSKKK